MAARASVVVTGASTGIGEACAFYLERMGFQVFAGVRRTQDGEALRRRSSDGLSPVLLDVTDPASIGLAAEKVDKLVGPTGLWGLVNNAGIVVAGMLEFLPLSALRTQLEVNLIGQLAVTQAFLPLLRRAGGRIVNMGSVSGLVAPPFMGAYAASKFAFEALTDVLRQELRPWGLHVSIIEPGNVRTPVWEKSFVAAEEMLGKLPARAHELYGRQITAARQWALQEAQAAIPPDAVARAVLHALTAAKPKTRYTVGSNAMVDSLLRRFVPDRLRDALIARYLKI